MENGDRLRDKATKILYEDGVEDELSIFDLILIMQTIGNG